MRLEGGPTELKFEVLGHWSSYCIWHVGGGERAAHGYLYQSILQCQTCKPCRGCSKKSGIKEVIWVHPHGTMTVKGAHHSSGAQNNIFSSLKVIHQWARLLRIQNSLKILCFEVQLPVPVPLTQLKWRALHVMRQELQLRVGWHVPPSQRRTQGQRLNCISCVIISLEMDHDKN